MHLGGDVTHRVVFQASGSKNASPHIEFEPLDLLLKIMEARFREPLEIRSIAKEIDFSANYLSYLFKRTFHTTFTNYLNVLRVWHAQLLLEYGLAPKEIATECGFKNVYYFTTVFTQKCKITLGRYRQTCFPKDKVPPIPRVAPTTLPTLRPLERRVEGLPPIPRAANTR